MTNFNSGIKFQKNTSFPFSNFDFSKFESFTFASAKTEFSADNVFGDDAKVFDFAFISTFNFSDFAKFFVEEFAPKLQKGSFVKFNFFNFDKEFNFAEFNEFSNQFSKQGIFIEFSFFRAPAESFDFDGFNFSEFFSPTFNGDFFFFVNCQNVR